MLVLEFMLQHMQIYAVVHADFMWFMHSKTKNLCGVLFK